MNVESGNKKQQIKTFGVTATLLLRHCRHQVAPEPPQHNAVCPSFSWSLFFFHSSSNLVPFLFFSFLLFYTSFHLISIFCFLSPRSLSILLPLLSLTTSCSLSHPPSLFRSPFLSVLLSWFCCTCAVSKVQRWVTLWEIPSPSSSLW